MPESRPALSLTAAQRRAAAAACRAADTDLFFAAHFLRRDARAAVHVIAAVERTLFDVMAAKACDGQGGCGGGGNCHSSQEPHSHQHPPQDDHDHASCDTPRPRHVRVGECKSSPPQAATCSSGTPIGAGECASGGSGGGGETPEMRRAVCSSVLEHLFDGKPTGRSDLDGFAAVARAYGLDRCEFEAYCDGVTAWLPLKRVATWAKLRRLCESRDGSLALIASRVLLRDRRLLDDESWRARARALATAVRMTILLASVGEEWARQRLMIPLDDLVAAGLTPSDISRFHAQGSAANDTRWRRLIDAQVERVARLFDGGMSVAGDLTPDGRRAVSVFAQVHRELLDRVATGKADPFSAICPLGLLDRLSLLPGAISAAAR